MNINGKRPNFLIIMTDEERYPPPYENAEARDFRIRTGKAREKIRANGIEFKRHYTASTACAPSRTSIYTGQYPSLHGVSQTPGIGKSSFDPSMYWLDPATVPTLGAWFRQGGYQTYWRGKWHISYEDLTVPGTRTALLSNDDEGHPYPDRIKLYHEADRLEKYGYSGWIGPEPHGSEKANDGTNRDGGYAQQVCRILDKLDNQARQNPTNDEPWLVVSSFVNPHDIVFSGVPWFPAFEKLHEEGKLPHIEPPPTLKESLATKPRAQQDYVWQYPHFYLPQPSDQQYYQFYYYLMAEVDRHILKVYDKLQNCSFYENTIVLFLSDHGDTLGAHGGMHQKWYNAYEETLHVPMIVSNPVLFPKPRCSEMLTSHIDLLPTMLGLAGIEEQEAAAKLVESHSEVRELVGRDLTPVVRGEAAKSPGDESIYFMTDDKVETGLSMTNRLSGRPYPSVIQPNSVESVITRLNGQIWKYTRYFDNDRFVGQPGNQTPDQVPVQRFFPDQFECYNISEDPTEVHNRMSEAGPDLPPPIEKELAHRLKQQRHQKRLLPHNLNKTESEKGPLRT